jgi:hypothetical protein
MKPKYFVWLVAIGVLLGALILQFLRIRNVKDGDINSHAKPVSLNLRIPLHVAGWSAVDEPLGPTEFLQAEMHKNLNYDDVVNRTYHNNARSFGLYVAYWSASRMPVQKVASHTPDRCWTENGWKCEQLRAGEYVPLKDGQLKPAYWRLFTAPGSKDVRQYVLYWHLVGDELYDYGDGFNQRPDPWKWWRDTVHYAIKGSASQYFIRLTSARPFEEIQSDPGFQQVLAGLAQLGLRAEDRPVGVNGK